MKRPGHLIALVVLSATVVLAQQPVGDAAAKAKPKKASRVITDDDFPQRSSESQPSAARSEERPTSASDKAAASESKADGNGAKSTDKKGSDTALEAMQSRLQELESDETNLTNGNKNLEEKIANEEASGRREVLENMLANRKRSLERTKSERSDIARQIEALKKKK